MLLRLLAILAICAVPNLSGAQLAHSGSATRVVSAPDGGATFDVPVRWRVVPAGEADMAFAYRVPNPAGDSIPRVTTNVLLSIERQPVRRQFAAQSDAMLSRWITRDMLVLDDSTVKRQRSVFWRGEADKVVYVGFDNIAEVDGTWVHVRIILPLVGSPAAWARTFSSETAALLRSVRVRGRQAFPADFGYPVLGTFQPSR